MYDISTFSKTAETYADNCGGFFEVLAKSKETNEQKLTNLAVEPTRAWHGILKYPQISLNISSSDAYISVTTSEATAHPPNIHCVFREGAFVLFRISDHLRSFVLCWLIIYLFSLLGKVHKLPGSKCTVIWFIFTSGVPLDAQTDLLIE